MRLYLSNIKKVKPDLVVLACTHYPIIKKEIKDFLGDVEILDPADLISQELQRFLVSNHLQSKSSKKGGFKFLVTDTVEHFAKIAKELLREEVSGKIERIKLTQ